MVTGVPVAAENLKQTTIQNVRGIYRIVCVFDVNAKLDGALTSTA